NPSAGPKGARSFFVRRSSSLLLSRVLRGRSFWRIAGYLSARKCPLKTKRLDPTSASIGATQRLDLQRSNIKREGGDNDASEQHVRRLWIGSIGTSHRAQPRQRPAEARE